MRSRPAHSRRPSGSRRQFRSSRRGARGFSVGMVVPVGTGLLIEWDADRALVDRPGGHPGRTHRSVLAEKIACQFTPSVGGARCLERRSDRIRSSRTGDGPPLHAGRGRMSGRLLLRSDLARRMMEGGVSRLPGGPFARRRYLSFPGGASMGCGSIVIAQPEIIILFADCGYHQADFACSDRLLTSPEQNAHPSDLIRGGRSLASKASSSREDTVDTSVPLYSVGLSRVLSVTPVANTALSEKTESKGDNGRRWGVA